MTRLKVKTKEWSLGIGNKKEDNGQEVFCRDTEAKKGKVAELRKRICSTGVRKEVEQKQEKTDFEKKLEKFGGAIGPKTKKKETRRRRRRGKEES